MPDVINVCNAQFRTLILQYAAYAHESTMCCLLGYFGNFHFPYLQTPYHMIFLFVYFSFFVLNLWWCLYCYRSFNLLAGQCRYDQLNRHLLTCILQLLSEVTTHYLDLIHCYHLLCLNPALHRCTMHLHAHIESWLCRVLIWFHYFYNFIKIYWLC